MPRVKCKEKKASSASKFAAFKKVIGYKQSMEDKEKELFCKNGCCKEQGALKRHQSYLMLCRLKYYVNW